MTTIDSPGPRRTALAVDGARATVEAAFAGSSSQRTRNLLFQGLLLSGLVVALAGLSAILIWAISKGWNRLSPDLLTEGPSTLRPETAGFRTAVLGSVYIIGGVLVMIIPVGVGAAVYLEEYADTTRWWNRIIELNIQNLAAVPSIVYGILGLAFIVRGPLSIGFVPAAASLTLALLVLPTIILASREALRAVPPSIREGALALGATEWRTIRRLVLPAAIPGILTGVILSISRAIGEAAPLLLVGAVTFATFDPSYFDSGYTTLPTLVYSYFRRPQVELQELAAAGVLLMLIFVLTTNSFAIWLRNRYEQRW